MVKINENLWVNKRNIVSIVTQDDESKGDYRVIIYTTVGYDMQHTLRFKTREERDELVKVLTAE